MKMKEFWTLTRVCFSAIGGWLGYFLGGCDNLMIALIVFVVADYVTGVMCAIIDKKLSSEVGFKGIFKKVLIFILVGIAHILTSISSVKPISSPSLTMVIMFCVLYLPRINGSGLLSVGNGNVNAPVICE
mgnify:CR=1 FL=1